MAINKKSFLSAIKRGIGRGVDALGDVAAAPERIRSNRRAEKDVDRIMKRFYPSYTVTGQKKYNQRRKEFLDEYKRKGPIPVIKKAKALKAQFKKDNPAYRPRRRRAKK